MRILGVTHPLSLNSAACLFEHGRLIAFAEEERFIRFKHAPHVYPLNAIKYCFEQADIQPNQIDLTAIGFERPNAAHARLANADRYVAGSLSEEDWFGFSTSLSLINGDTQIKPFGQPWYGDHHLCHAASAAVCSGFPRTNFITLDAWGGKSSGILGIFDHHSGLKVLREIPANHSWGMFYELITEYLGFRCHSEEGKTMGLASMGHIDNKLLPDFCESELGLPDVKRYEAYLSKSSLAREGRDGLTESHRSMAATLQHYYEKSLVRISRWLVDRTGCRCFALAGGVALNCTGNGTLARQSFVDEIFIQPASHDAGTALGAAILAHREQSGKWPEAPAKHAYWGPGYSSEEIRSALDFARVPYEHCEPAQTAAQALAADQIVGWFQGRAEVGPRALGNRSILAHPGKFHNLDRVNLCVKRREPWRPLAPSVLQKHYHDIFDMNHESPFMLLAGQVRTHWRDRIPAVVHVDGSARPQTVTAETNPLYHDLISRFENITGLPVVLNTSFNHSDEPLVNSPDQAIATFFRTGMDTLVIGDFVIRKEATKIGWQT
jgi:carbamoyltransferase